MKVYFCLTWARSPVKLSQAFKHFGLGQSFKMYQSRINAYAKCGILPRPQRGWNSGKLSRVMLCDIGDIKTVRSSECISQCVSKYQTDSVENLYIVIGGADGISEAMRQEYAAAYLWSFGKLTLPHELAAVVAAEQIYRAFTIINHHPYHAGH